MYLKDQHIREIEARLNTVNQDNELLRAQVQESDYWIYDRGPIAEELHELRQSGVTNNVELNRLQRENTRLHANLRRAEGIVTDAGRRIPRHDPGHPPVERSSITQTNINHLFERSRSAPRSPTIERQRF